MVLLIENVGLLRVHLHVVHALPHFRFPVGQEIGADAGVSRCPRLAVVIRAEDARGRQPEGHLDLKPRPE